MLKYDIYSHLETINEQCILRNSPEMLDRNVHKKSLLHVLESQSQVHWRWFDLREIFCSPPSLSSVSRNVLRRRFPGTGDEAASSPLKLDVRFWTEVLSVSL